MIITKKHKLIAVGAVIIILLVSLWRRLSPSPIPSPVVVNQPIASLEPILIKSDEVLTTAITDLQASISALLARIEVLEASGSLAPSSAPNAVSSPQTVFQPQNIYLGSANTTNTDWADTGAEVRLNSADYPNYVHAVFEASLSIVGGEAWARLKNKTTGAILSVTEIFHNTGTATWKTSNNFQLHNGNNIYVVQLKSSSGETAYLSGARIRISQ